MVKKIEVRCLNCFERIEVDSGTARVACPKCGIQYKVAWPAPRQAKIVGRMRAG